MTGAKTDEATATEMLGGTTSTEQSSGGAEGEDVSVETPAQKQPTGKLAQVKDAHTERLKGGLALTMSSGLNHEMASFKKHWIQYKAKYLAVSAEASVPAELIAAIHWRESSGSFKKYLHQGDPLGKQAVNVPTNIPIFHDWHKAAVHALTMKDKAANRDNLGVNAGTEDPATLASYAEAYNGLGYHNKKTASPYVYSGTDAYTSGKYVADSQYSSSAVDKQLGVITMMGAIGGMDISLEKLTSSTAWKRVEAGTLLLKRGVGGKAAEMAVTALQEKLKEAGQTLGVDGDFGSGTEKALKAFQRSKGLPQSGALDAATLDAL
ncbi:MAG: lysozyme family protein [Cognaticolwellia sp.]